MKKIFLALAILGLAIGPTPFVMAQCAFPPCSIPDAQQTILGAEDNGSGIGGGIALINKITNWMFTILLVLAVVFILFAAFKYLFSGGSEEAVGSAHSAIIYAVVAIAVAFLAKGIVFVVQELVTSGYSAGAGNGNGNGVNVCIRRDAAGACIQWNF